MDLPGRSFIRRPYKKIVITSSDEPSHDLLFYTSPPTSTIPLDVLCKLAEERIRALEILERIITCTASKDCDMDVIKEVLLQEFEKKDLKTYAKLLVSNGSATPTESDLQARSKDHISHFIVRLTHCHSVNRRRWFMNGEVALFKLRFSSLNSEGIRNFLTAYNIEFISIPLKEKQSLMPFLLSSTNTDEQESVESMDFFKIPFREVPDLVGTRRVFLKGGYAYVPSQNLLSIITSIFKRNLQRGVCLAAACMAHIRDDERLKMLFNLHEVNISEPDEQHKKRSQVKPEDLDYLSKVSYPPCMKQIHEDIRITHHARYGARQQYGSFLKSIGLSLKHSIKFWRNEFIRKMSLEKFEKSYVYYIRYQYGLVGRRIPYPEKSCTQLLSHHVGSKDCHGCPFKHRKREFLEKLLATYGISAADLPSIMNLVTEQKYELACTQYFRLKHPDFPAKVIDSPLFFFELSEKFHFPDSERPYRKRKHNQSLPIIERKGTSSCKYSELTSSDDDCDKLNSWSQCSDMDIESLSSIGGTSVL